MASLSAIKAHLLRNVGQKSDAANAAGSMLAQLAELLTNRITTTIMGRIDAALSTLVANSGGIIQSIQQGTIVLTSAVSGTATISSVATGKAECNYLGQSNVASDVGTTQNGAYVDLQNATTVRAQVDAASSITVGFGVVEHK